MTAVPGPGQAGEPAAAFAEFVAVMARLRAECAWKAEQTHHSLGRYLLEETYETMDAIALGEESGDWSALADELGDVLLQVVFHAAIAAERGDFDIDDVARGITAKMRRRNPHVFGDVDASGLDAAAVNDLWQQMKAQERPRSVQADSLPSALPALMYADKVLERRARAGIPVELAPEDAEVGERLLALVAEARAAGIDPEQALRDAVRSRL